LIGGKVTDNITIAQDFASSLRTKIKQEPKEPGSIQVDPNYEEDPKVAPIVEYAIKRRNNFFIVGPTGCGKSTLAIQIGARLNERFEIFSCSGETTTDEIIGKPWRKPDGTTVTIHGAAVRSYKNGKGLLLEEVDHANPDILAALHRPMETNQNFITLNIGDEEIITRNKDFFVIATANTIGTGEDALCMQVQSH
jgi:MoxR-like ATPase